MLPDPTISADSADILKALEHRIANYRRCIGYPVNLALDVDELITFFQRPLYNVGTLARRGADALDDASHDLLGTRQFEREVLRDLASLFGLGDDEPWFGYVTSGGTEGNLFGLYLARERYPDGVLYFSRDRHYSVSKAARLLGMEHEEVASLERGQIDLDALGEALRRHRGRPAILCLNIGSTMKGAIDEVAPILDLLERCEVEEHYIHCDAALFGMMLPFIEGSPCPSFAQPIDSLVISGHKFIGSPIPSGVVLTRKGHVDRISQDVEYAKTPDVTIAGTRNGHAPLLLWHALRTRGLAGLARETATCLENARYLQQALVELGYDSWLNPHSNIVMLDRPPEAIVDSWDLAIEGRWAHVVVMQHVTRPLIDAFLADLRAYRQQPEAATAEASAALGTEIVATYLSRFAADRAEGDGQTPNLGISLLRWAQIDGIAASLETLGDAPRVLIEGYSAPGNAEALRAFLADFGLTSPCIEAIDLVDIEEFYRARGVSIPGLERFTVADAGNMSSVYADASVDLVVQDGLFNCAPLAARAAIMAEAVRVLAPHGRVLAGMTDDACVSQAEVIDYSTLTQRYGLAINPWATSLADLFLGGHLMSRVQLAALLEALRGKVLREDGRQAGGALVTDCGAFEFFTPFAEVEALCERLGLVIVGVDRSSGGDSNGMTCTRYRTLLEKRV